MQNQPETFLIELIRYNNWANAQVIAACQTLSEEQFDAAAPGTYGSIRATLMHLLWAESDYIGRLTGDRPYPSFQRDHQPSPTDLSAFAGQVADALLATAQHISLSQIVHEEEDGNTIDYQACALFIQVINHGVEHRTNITTILSSLGLATPELDGWGYLFAHQDRFQLKESSK